MVTSIARLFLQSCLFFTALLAPAYAGKIIDFNQAITLAQQNDPWLRANRHAQDALLSDSIAAGALPDPDISLGMANLAADSFNFSQEQMTNARIGISQKFPAGHSRALTRQQLELMGSQHPYQREDRKARVAVTVGGLWLEIYKIQQTIKLVEKSRLLFEQLADQARSGYATTLGKSRQQDIIRAELELTRLDDRLTRLHQAAEMRRSQLGEWLSSGITDHRGDFISGNRLPDIQLLNSAIYKPSAPTNAKQLFENISTHPALRAIEQRVRASETAIDLERQKYKPAWGISAGYGYRANDLRGNSRSDLFSLGVTFSVPLFTANRQDRKVQSAKSRSSAIKVEKWQMARKLMASFESTKVQFRRLGERQKLYGDILLPQLRNQTEAARMAYANDEGGFAEMVRARIAEIDGQVEALKITVDRQKTILQLNYFFISQARDMLAGDAK